MARKSRQDEIFEALRARGLRKRVARSIAEASGRTSRNTPKGVKKVFRSETEFVFAVYRTQLFKPDDLESMQRLRCAFDPAGLANPGKVMPTPRLCGEVPGPYRIHPLEAAGLAERF